MRLGDLPERVLRAPHDQRGRGDPSHLLGGEQVGPAALHFLEAQQVVDALDELGPVVDRVPDLDQLFGDVLRRVVHEEVEALAGEVDVVLGDGLARAGLDPLHDLRVGDGPAGRDEREPPDAARMVGGEPPATQPPSDSPTKWARSMPAASR